MNDEDKNKFFDEFKKADGSTRLDMWDYALEQQVIWESVITELTAIAKKQGVDKKLEQLVEEELQKIAD